MVSRDNCRGNWSECYGRTVSKVDSPRWIEGNRWEIEDARWDPRSRWKSAGILEATRGLPRSASSVSKEQSLNPLKLNRSRLYGFDERHVDMRNHPDSR